MSQEDGLELDNKSEGRKARLQAREEQGKNQRKGSENEKMVDSGGHWEPDSKGLGKHLNIGTEQEGSNCKGF